MTEMTISTNGSTRAPANRTDISPLKEKRRKAHDLSMLQWQEREQEIEDTQRDLTESRLLVHKLEIDVEGLQSQRATLESRIHAYQAERDEAVAMRAHREAILTSILALLDHAGVRLPERGEQAEQDQ